MKHNIIKGQQTDDRKRIKPQAESFGTAYLSLSAVSLFSTEPIKYNQGLKKTGEKITLLVENPFMMLIIYGSSIYVNIWDQFE